MPLRISVLASGSVLLDGRPVGLRELETVLAEAKASNKTVLYYRENSAANASPIAEEVIQAVTRHKLPISLSTKPDFSDYVDASGHVHPRADDRFAPRMPEVRLIPDLENAFSAARKMAAAGTVIVRPSRKALAVPRMTESPALRAGAEGLAKLIPGDRKRNIVAIAFTDFAPPEVVAPSLADANLAIPFFGMLLGLTYLGHAVWVFEGHESALAAGCREADVLIVDSGMAPLLAAGWQDVAAQAMRNPNILFHDRKTFRLLVVRKAGGGPGLGFPA
ncbi:MAG TPA: hypothetical protein VMI94_27195 [Bryobacteraceae bacterium]|nr:hypothetical protein [Bryobacteraceae bacterium]